MGFCFQARREGCPCVLEGARVSNRGLIRGFHGVILKGLCERLDFDGGFGVEAHISLVMAGEGNESRVGRMDLNLYLGLPRSPRPRSSDLDLGSDLALSSLPLSTSSTTDESQPPLEMSSVREPTVPHAPYSPSHASFTPPVDPVDPADDNSNQEYTPYSPSYEPYTPIPAMMPEPNTPDSPPPNGRPSPTPHETEEPQEPHVSYTPSYVPRSPYYIPLDTQEANDDPLTVSPLRTVSPLVTPFVPPLLPDVSMYAPPMLPYVPRSPSPAYSPRSPSYAPPRDDESSSRQELFESPEYRFRRLIESSHRLRLRRFRSSLPYHGSERSNFGRPTSPVPDQLPGHDVMSSQRSLDTNGKHKVPAEVVATESSEENKEEKSNAAANFECNICLEMALEPVVTSCGHLFCWPCLYQWLHVHSEHKECPVCKGEVTESNITPIYGRGSSEASNGKKLAENGESNLKVPPRPRGSRFESLRQQFRPISRRFGEGFATSWRRLMNQQMRNRNRLDGNGDPAMPGMFSADFLSSLRARRLPREELNAEFGTEAEEIRLPLDSAAIPQNSNTNSLFRDGVDLWRRHRDSSTMVRRSSDISPLLHDGIDFWHQHRDSSTNTRSSDVHSVFRDGIDPWHRSRESTTVPRSSDISTDPLLPDRAELWHQLNVYGLYATADIGRVVGNGNRYGASTSSVNPPSPEQVIPRANNAASASAADQVSASSTVAVIQGDVGLPEGSAEPNSAGSSRSYRRRGRSSASGSLDVDGVLHARKRRRLN